MLTNILAEEKVGRRSWSHQCRENISGEQPCKAGGGEFEVPKGGKGELWVREEPEEEALS